MDKQTTRAFAAGILIAALILFGFKSFFEKPPEEKPAIKSGYMEISKKEYEDLNKQVQAYETQVEELTANKEKIEVDKKETVTKEDDKKEKVEEVEQKSIIYELHITEGMSSSEISKILEKEKIIKKGADFNQYLEKQGLQRYVQLGSFVLNDEMDFYEIAKIITKDHK